MSGIIKDERGERAHTEIYRKNNMKIREKSALFQQYIKKAGGNVQTFDALRFSKKKQVLEGAIKSVSEDQRACSLGDSQYGELFVLRQELEIELQSLVDGVESSGSSSMMGQESLRATKKLDDRGQRHDLRRRK